MLKLYRSTIIASFVVATGALCTGLLCEWFRFPHWAFVQNLAIGLFCSLLVVIITSVLQYKHTQKKDFNEYARALWNLVSKMEEAYLIEDCAFMDEFYEPIFKKVDDAFVRFDLYVDELVWFSPKKQKYTDLVSTYCNRIHMNYIHKTLQSDKDAVLYLSGNKDYIEMIDASILLLEGTTIGEMLQDEREYISQKMQTK